MANVNQPNKCLVACAKGDSGLQPYHVLALLDGYTERFATVCINMRPDIIITRDEISVPELQSKFLNARILIPIGRAFEVVSGGKAGDKGKSLHTMAREIWEEKYKVPTSRLIQVAA